MNYSYEVKLDIDKDIWNWYEGCNKSSHGLDWKQRVPSEVYQRVAGLPKNSAYEFLRDFLGQKYIDEKTNIDNYREHLENIYHQKFTQACQKLEEITKKPLCRNHFTIYLTTFPREPYNYEEASIFAMVGWRNIIRNFMHEALHFQLIHYWVKESPDSAIAKLDGYSFNWLNESLTVVLDEDLLPLIESPDKGYEIHAAFRNNLHGYWMQNKNFNNLVDYGLRILPEHINEE